LEVAIIVWSGEVSEKDDEFEVGVGTVITPRERRGRGNSDEPVPKRTSPAAEELERDLLALLVRMWAKSLGRHEWLNGSRAA